MADESELCVVLSLSQILPRKGSRGEKRVFKSQMQIVAQAPGNLLLPSRLPQVHNNCFLIPG